VRAVALTTNPSGSYYNPAQGTFVTATVGSSGSPILLSVATIPAGVRLSWNTQPGTAYHVVAASDLGQQGWTNVSGTITAGSTTASWTDTNASANAHRFYRVSSP